MGVNRTNTDQFQLRLPPGLRERLKAEAAKNSRSLNAEIVHRLENSLIELILRSADEMGPGISFEDAVEVRTREVLRMAMKHADEMLRAKLVSEGRDPNFKREGDVEK